VSRKGWYYVPLSPLLFFRELASLWDFQGEITAVVLQKY
jgi:hypothetical protein